jgi:hypothetical protein
MSDTELDGSQYEIPQSRGMPPPVRWFFLMGLALIVAMGAISSLESGHFHVWPIGHSTQIPLVGG